MINWGDIVHQEYTTPTDVEDDVIQEVDRTNAVYTRGGNIEKIDDFKYIQSTVSSELLYSYMQL